MATFSRLASPKHTQNQRLDPRERKKLRLAQDGQGFGGERELDASRDSWLSGYEAELFESDDHLVNGWRR